MLRLQATPFVPGRARGVLRRGREASAPDSLLVVTQQELGPLPAPPAGLVVVGGAPLSHPMIRLLGLGVPAILLAPEEAGRLPFGVEALLDGASGVLESPVREPAAAAPVPPPPRAGVPVAMADGTAVELRASVADAAGAARALAAGAGAIGLVRSEFLIPAGGRVPDSEFYVEALDAVCRAAHPLPVTLRFLDLAADKRPPWLGPMPGLSGALGLQGARLYGIEPVRSVFHAQIAAVERLATRHRLRLLVPYVVALDEFERWRDEIRGRLSVAMPVGTMAETPAAALQMADWFAAADFVALGCNDLMQCLFAADRDLPELRGFLDPHAPVLFRFLRQIAQAAGGHLARVQVCGLLPQLPGVLPVMLGLGYRVFSVEPSLIPYLAQAVMRVDAARGAALAEQVCAARHAREVRALLGLPAGASLGLPGILARP